MVIMLRSKIIPAFLFSLALSLLISQGLAHTPLNPLDEIHSLETAFEVPDPTKSWALYRELHDEGEAEYFKLHLNPGERLRISLYIKETKENFFPHLVIMSRDLALPDDFPNSIEKPEDFGGIVIEPLISENSEYEPFTPASYYYLIDVDETISKEGDYYVVVYEPNSVEGKYGIAIGYKEEFTLSEWLLIPFDVISIHQWEGQSLIFILAPLLIALFSGVGLLLWKYFKELSLFKIIGSIAGLLYIGSGLMILIQMIIALSTSPFNSSAVITGIFIALPLLLGLLLMRKIVRFKGKLLVKDRVVLASLGLIGLFTWSGLLIGPSLAIVSSFFPSRFLEQGNNK